MRLRVITLGLLVLLVAAIVTVGWISGGRHASDPGSPVKALPVLHTVPAFELENSMGKAINRESLDGKVWIADLIFTTCANTCPKMTSTMATLHHDYKDQENLSFVSVSVNPQYDRPNVLADYAEYYDADPDRWHFLTGSLDAIKDMSMKGLMIGNKDNPVDHSSYFVLVDAQCRVRGYYDGMDEEAVGRLRIDVDQLLSASTGSLQGDQD